MVSEAMTAPGPKNVSQANGFLETNAGGVCFALAELASALRQVGSYEGVLSFKREIVLQFHFANRR
jgi:hypothetical protein